MNLIKKIISLFNNRYIDMSVYRKLRSRGVIPLFSYNQLNKQGV